MQGPRAGRGGGQGVASLGAEVNYGAGGGVMVGFGSPPSRLMLDVAVRYVAGSQADYLTEGAIRRENGAAILDVTRSRTDVIAVYIGVAWSTR